MVYVHRMSDRWEALRLRLAPLEKSGCLRCERLAGTDGMIHNVPDEVVGRQLEQRLRLVVLLNNVIT